MTEAATYRRDGPIRVPKPRDTRLRQARETSIKADANDDNAPTRTTFYPRDDPFTRTACIDADLDIVLAAEECQ